MGHPCLKQYVFWIHSSCKQAVFRIPCSAYSGQQKDVFLEHQAHDDYLWSKEDQVASHCLSCRYSANAKAVQLEIRGDLSTYMHRGKAKLGKVFTWKSMEEL